MDDIKNLKEIVDLCEKEIKNNDDNTTAILDIADLKSLKNILNELDKLQKENEKLIADNLEYQRTQDIFDERTYRKKYLEERRKEQPNLLYPDADEIYKRYYELKEENEELKQDNSKQWKERCRLSFEVDDSIPKQVIRDKLDLFTKRSNVFNYDNEIHLLEELLGE